MAALLVLSALMMFAGVSILVHNNPWRTNPAPLQPITSTTPTPTTTRIIEPPMSPQAPGSPQWCAQYPNDRENCGPTTTTPPGMSCPLDSPKSDGTCDLTDWGFQPGDEPQKLPTQKEQCEALQYKPPVCQTLTTEPTQKPDEFPPDVMCKALHYEPPGCATVVPTVPNMPGVLQMQIG